VDRPASLRFDLDGVAKGWLADRALAIAPGQSAMIDADGDIAARFADGDSWIVGVADPREDPDGLLAVIHLGSPGSSGTLGLATSGTSIHRWDRSTGTVHHLIDPATWRSVPTDVVQATVLAESARLAEGFAKAAVIAGAADAFELASRPGIHGMLVLTAAGELRASDGLVRWLA
jgi:thiamine biosynthesis lipoprotein